MRACVHCGFCNATCPTYQLLGDELDGPRGRIYLIKSLLEGADVTHKTQTHLDRCLTCRACETTCPSGVQYGRLLDLSRPLLEAEVKRPPRERLLRWLIRTFIPHRRRFGALLGLARWLRPFLPGGLHRSLPPRVAAASWPAPRHAREMLMLDGCVQPALKPDINAAAARVLDKLGIGIQREDFAGCCGALSYHLGAHQEAFRFMRRNIDAWWPHIERGAEAIIVTASGCAPLVKDYGRLLRDDPAYADKAARISAIAKDISEVLSGQDLSALKPASPPGKIAFHSPCSLQHGLKITNVVENLLNKLGFELTPAPDGHLCCGAAGAYPIVQKELSQRLLTGKLRALQSGGPACIATANIGCLVHMQSASNTPVKHWIELLDSSP